MLVSIKDSLRLTFTNMQKVICYSLTLLIVFIIPTIVFAQTVETGSFENGGRTRDYIVVLPQSYNSTSNMPVIFNLHGKGSTAQQALNWTGTAFSDSAGYIAVYPNAINKEWYLFESHDVDVKFFDALIDTLNSNYSIDLKRIYSCGWSRGGCFSFILACKLSERIAAIAPVAAFMPEWLSTDCNPQRAVPVLMINGTADKLDPWDGMEGFISVEKSFYYWVNFNSCTESDTLSLPDLDPSDGCTVEKITYTNGIANSSVVLYKVINGGHCWPGTPYDPYTSFLGNLNKDISADVEIWNFFKNYELSESTGVTSHSKIPIGFSLSQNYPNPFNPSTTINYRLDQAGMVNLIIYDLLGSKVTTLVDEMKYPGSYAVTWNAEDFASGVYFYRIELGGSKVLTRKMLLMK